MAVWSTVGLNGVNSVGGVVCLWACAVHPASSWTALGQVVAALLSLPSFSLPRLAVPCVLFFFLLSVCFLEVVIRADATETFSSCPHAGRYYCLTHCPYGRAVLHWYRACVCEYHPCVREYRPVFLWFRRICLCCSRGMSWPALGRSVRAAGRAYATIVGRLCPLSR